MERKSVNKIFLITQYEKEEKYLSEMMAKGWKLVNIEKSFPGAKYEFERCNPKDYSYQLDYILNGKDKGNYIQLFKDAGWENVTHLSFANGAWYYFCKENTDGRKQKIFTDQESRIGLINRLIFSCVIVSFLIFTMQLVGISNMYTHIFQDKVYDIYDIVFASITIIILLVPVVFILFLIKMKYTLKKQMKDRL